ncbi:glycosyltransferase family 15 protein [Crucibulum laeve]|uniref:Glycosyltransferase family 15 protein n=1 Tax=Crucibulum laeve TaxID=68775 RepID=A0A5C3M1C1_9AGAR|nr:glycosyltransferase family 15 protein [Crucibulum laeve]
MNTSARYIIVVLAVIISLHYILSFTQEDYGRATSLSNIASKFKPKPVEEKSPVDEYVNAPAFNDTLHVDNRANASFVILARNSDLDGAVRSIRDIEDRFNRRYRYPYVFLNEEPFSDNFKKRISVLTSAKVEFGLIPKEHWFQPDWIDEEKAKASRDKMVKDNIIYGGSVSYRNMCRFNSGFFFKHELLQKYRWYWRIEPDVHFHCDINFDPFLHMEKNNKVYAFTITMYEYEATIPTLWGHVHDFMKLHPEYVHPNNAMGFMSENGGEKFNLCHFWSNFEIADMDFWRGPAYTAFFEYLDKQGGFYYERWGDAPVHSIAAALFTSRDQLQFFNEIGYEHNPYTHCPKGGNRWEEGRCSCDPARSFDYDGYSCMSKWDRFMDLRW